MVFLEYAWDMKWCDPCAANPLSSDELRDLGVFWADGARNQPPNVFLTRLHVKYDAAHFPEDLVFQETADRANFQGRYMLRHPWKGAQSVEEPCGAAREYRRRVRERQDQEAVNLASATGWNLSDIRKKMGLGVEAPIEPARWWQRIWK